MYVLACLLSSCPVTFSANIHLYTHISPAFIHVHALPLPHHLYTYMLLSSICTHTGAYIHLYTYIPSHLFIHVHGPLYLFIYIIFPCIHLYMYMPPRIIMYIPLHSFIHVQHPFIHAPASVYTCTCHWTHLYTYMPLHLFIHIRATVPIYTHTWHCIHLYTYMPLHPSIHIRVTVPVYTRPCPWALIPSTCSLILQVSSLFLALGCFYWNVTILWSRPPACAFP